MKNKIKNRSKFWNSFAHKYDKFIAKHANRSYTELVTNILKEVNSSDNVLEIGTGTGIISFAVNDKVRQVTAIDFAENMIKTAQLKHKELKMDNIIFEVGSAHLLKYPNHFFDTVIASNVFHLLPEPEKALNQIYKVLKPEGVLIIPTFCHGQNLRTQIISRILSITGFKAENKWSVKSFRKFIENGKFTVKREKIIKDRIPLSFLVGIKHKKNG